MKSFATNLDLPFKTREIILVKRKEIALSAKHNQTFNGLSQQKLMVERHIRPSIFQGKNNPDPHCLLFWGKKIPVNQTPLLKILIQRKAKVLKVKRIERLSVRIISFLKAKR